MGPAWGGGPVGCVLGCEPPRRWGLCPLSPHQPHCKVHVVWQRVGASSGQVVPGEHEVTVIIEEISGEVREIEAHHGLLSPWGLPSAGRAWKRAKLSSPSPAKVPSVRPLLERKPTLPSQCAGVRGVHTCPYPPQVP